MKAVSYPDAVEPTLRIAEWPVAFLGRPRRTPHTIPDFLAPDAPPNRLALLRGIAGNDPLQE
jgi:hypothetical protein